MRIIPTLIAGTALYAISTLATPALAQEAQPDLTEKVTCNQETVNNHQCIPNLEKWIEKFDGFSGYVTEGSGEDLEIKIIFYEGEKNGRVEAEEYANFFLYNQFPAGPICSIKDLEREQDKLTPNQVTDYLEIVEIQEEISLCVDALLYTRYGDYTLIKGFNHFDFNGDGVGPEDDLNGDNVLSIEDWALKRNSQEKL